jgi:hypothetical protein
MPLPDIHPEGGVGEIADLIQIVRVVVAKRPEVHAAESADLEQTILGRLSTTARGGEPGREGSHAKEPTLPHTAHGATIVGRSLPAEKIPASDTIDEKVPEAITAVHRMMEGAETLDWQRARHERKVPACLAGSSIKTRRVPHRKR